MFARNLNALPDQLRGRVCYVSKTVRNIKEKHTNKDLFQWPECNLVQGTMTTKLLHNPYGPCFPGITASVVYIPPPALLHSYSLARIRILWLRFWYSLAPSLNRYWACLQNNRNSGNHILKSLVLQTNLCENWKS